MILVDVHAHLEMCKGVEGVIQRAKDAGVVSIITNGSTVDANRKALGMAKEHDLVQAAVGLYPVESVAMSDEAIADELAFIAKQELAAIGEIGLDYEKTEDREKQQSVFEQQLSLARTLNKTVIVHSRKAEQEVVDTLIAAGNKKVILHAFHGSKKIAATAADVGFHFSVPSNVGRSSHFQQLVALLPLQSILTETDAPFLAQEKEGASEPAHVAATIQVIAKIKNLTEEETANIVYANYQRLF